MKTIFTWLRRRKSRPQPATKQDLDQLEKHIMSAISDYTTQVDAKLEAINTSTEALNTNVEGVSADVAALKKLIEQINNNPGTITPADQALLDQSLAKLGALESKVSGLNTALQSLNDATDLPAEPPVES